jgi:hypothetical protein
MKNSYKDTNKTLLYCVEVFERQFALIKLPVEEYLLDDILDVGLYPFGGGIVQRPRRRFDRVGKHYYACLLGLRLRA